VLRALLAALPFLLAAAPQPAAQEADRGAAGPFSWRAADAVLERTRPITATAGEELARIEAWLGLPPSPGGELTWVEDRAAFERALGGDAPRWFAAVTIPGQRRILIQTDRAPGQTQLLETFRHELVHWAMIGLGDRAWDALPAWFHEGIAEQWARTDPLSQYASPLAWRAFRGELRPLSDFRDGFGPEPYGAAEGYALGFAFVRRLERVHGPQAIAAVLAEVRAGASLDQALVAVTGLALVTHEEELRRELGSWSALLGELYPQLFLGLALFALAVAPLARRLRRQRRTALEAKWAREDAALADEEAEEDDRWIRLP
jgi:hypothetical protein